MAHVRTLYYTLKVMQYNILEVMQYNYIADFQTVWYKLELNSD